MNPQPFTHRPSCPEAGVPHDPNAGSASTACSHWQSDSCWLCWEAQAGNVVYAPRVYEFPGRGKRRGHALTVRAVRRPEPDLKKLTQALIQIALDQQKRDKDQAAQLRVMPRRRS